jgi:glucuronoarabinoxylan endo-1,4-beta-xylanase
MKAFIRRSLRVAVGLGLFSSAHSALAQSATVTVSSQKQLIRGIGGMSHTAWAGDLTAAERTLAFGNGDGQLGFSALRIPVSDGAPDSANVATAQAAVAAGAIVFATPWNAAGAMDSSQFSAYATHLNGFVTYMKNQGVDLYAISVQNEPDYGSQGGWRTWTAAQCHDFVLGYGSTITTKLISCESYNYAKSYYDPILDDSAALANVSVLGTHLYGTPVSSYPYPLFDTNGGGKERWMTEHYTDSTTDANSWPNALGVATELHHAMVDGQFDLYTWWYIVRSYGPIYTDGTVSKRGWCMAQFSKFIRPGFHRVDATATPISGVYVSAYQGPSNLVVVVVNTNASTQSLDVSITGSTASSFTRYTTSGTKSLANDGMVPASNGMLTLSLDAESVTTLYGAASDAVDAGASADTGTALDTGTGSASDTGTGTASDTGTVSDPDTGTASDTGTGIGTASDTGTGTVVGVDDGGNADGGLAINDGGVTVVNDAGGGNEPGASTGCACGIAPSTSSTGAWTALAAAGLVWPLRRRRAARRASPSGGGPLDRGY